MEIHLKNFNKEVRKRINNTVENGILVGKSKRNTCGEIMDYLYSLEGTANAYEMIYRKFTIGVTYIDAFKMYLYKNRKNLADDEDLIILSELLGIRDYDDLEAEISANIDLFQKMIEASYDFYNLNGLSKVIIVRSLTDSDNAFLTKVFPAHELDLKDYKTPITLERLLKNVINQQKYQKNTLEIQSPEEIINSIQGFITELFTVDRENALKLLLEMSTFDYKILKSTNSKEITLYQELSQSQIITKLLTEPATLNKMIQRIISNVQKYLTNKIPNINDEVTKKLIYKPTD